MPASEKRTISKFPLRLMASVRRTAEVVSAREGVSLNQFINVAVAEKLAHLEHEEWLRSRPARSDELITKALKALDRGRHTASESGDELPEGYERLRRRVALRKR